jgi:hypothetical protein
MRLGTGDALLDRVLACGVASEAWTIATHARDW